MDAPSIVSSSDSITLDGSRSTAAPPATIDRYIWTLVPPSL
jgi:hypothetical protein